MHEGLVLLGVWWSLGRCQDLEPCLPSVGQIHPQSKEAGTQEMRSQECMASVMGEGLPGHHAPRPFLGCTVGPGNIPPGPQPESEGDGAVGVQHKSPSPQLTRFSRTWREEPQPQGHNKVCFAETCVCISSKEPYLWPAAVSPCAQQRAACATTSALGARPCPLCSVISLLSWHLSLPVFGGRTKCLSPLPSSDLCPWPEGGSQRCCGSSCAHTPFGEALFSRDRTARGPWPVGPALGGRGVHLWEPRGTS